MTASCCFSLRSPPCNMPREFGQKQRNLEISAKYFVSLPEKCVSCGGGEANCILIHCGVRGQNIGFRFWHERPKIWVLHACLFSRQFDSIETKHTRISPCGAKAPQRIYLRQFFTLFPNFTTWKKVKCNEKSPSYTKKNLTFVCQRYIPPSPPLRMM